MRKIKEHAIAGCLLFIACLLSGGCTLVNISLAPAAKPLEERVVEGEGRPKILLLEISGFISESEGTSLIKQKVSMVAYVREALRIAERDKDIAGIILKINSPGGTVTASDVIYHELTNFRKKRGIPLYACIISLGTSGGYYIASAADEIFAHPAAITGSIGVIAVKFNVEGLLTKIGIQNETIKSGDKKDIMSPFRAVTPEEREILQGIINSLFNRFLTVAYEGRKGLISRETLNKLADGRIYTAEQALDAKLIDRLGYLDDAIGEMKKNLGVKEARVVTYYRPGDFKETIYSALPAESFIYDYMKERFGQFSQMEFMYLWMP